MRKRRIILPILIVGVLSACMAKIETLESEEVFDATVEKEATKTSFGLGNAVEWSMYDRAVIGGQSYKVSSIKPDGRALFSGSGATPEGNVYKAWYPVAIYNGGSPALPAVQTVKSGRLDHLPMYAESTNRFLNFRNLCSVFRLSAKGSAKVTRIEVESKSKALWGPFSVSNSGASQWSAVLSGTDGQYRTLTLDCTGLQGGGVQLDLTTASDFFIAVPANSYGVADMTITIYSGETVLRTLANLDAAVVTERSKIHDIGAQTAWIEIDPTLGSDFTIVEGGTMAEREPTLSVIWQSSNTTFNEEGSTVDIASFSSSAPYKIQYSEWLEDGWHEWVDETPDWMTVTAPSSSSGRISLTVKAQQNSYEGHDRHTRILRSRTPVNGFDLSTYNVATGETGNNQSTANCYVVHAGGTYKFPLVYGNALKDGSPNDKAYHFQQDVYFIENNKGILYDYYKDHLGNDIMQPYITSQYPNATLTAKIVWTDAPGLVQDVAVNGGYMLFSVPQENICQGNAVIALLADGIIAWSWHIWVTDHDLSVVGKAEYAVANGWTLASQNVGWCDADTVMYARREARLRLVQPTTGKISQPVTISQSEKTIVTMGSSPYFQQGRKDPFRPLLHILEKTQSGNRETFAGKELYFDEYAPGVIAEDLESLDPWIQNPHLFSNTSYIPDRNALWGTKYIFNLWNSSLENRWWNKSGYSTPVSKTIYDPTPVGFMVPTVDCLTKSNLHWRTVGLENWGGFEIPAAGSERYYVRNNVRIHFPCLGNLSGSVNYIKDGSNAYGIRSNYNLYSFSTPASCMVINRDYTSLDPYGLSTMSAAGAQIRAAVEK